MRKKFLIICFVWIFILSIGAICAKWMLIPSIKEQQKQEEIAQEKARQENIIKQTVSDGRYKHHLSVSLDNFSGYSLLRSDKFKEELAIKKIKVSFIDDNGDYNKRINSVIAGETPIAVMTIDGLIRESEQYANGYLPVVIFGMVDESRGADAMIASKEFVPNIDYLNKDGIEYVLCKNTPSELLLRTVQSTFGVNILDTAIIDTNSPDDLFKVYQQSTSKKNRVYITWEPQASKILENKEMHLIADSSKFRGKFVDVFVVNRDFVAANISLVEDFMKAYLRTVYDSRNTMVEVVAKDSKINVEQAKLLIDKIQWKNTQEQYAHFGLNTGLPHIEDMIYEIVEILKNTGSINVDPTNGNPSMLYYDGIIKSLKNEDFHPGFAEQEEFVRDKNYVLPALNKDQWDKLIPVGTLKLEPLVFRRGTDKLSESSNKTLDNLIIQMKKYPYYYLIIKSYISPIGDLEANRSLATSRLEQVKGYLLRHGLPEAEICAIVELGEDSGVAFQVGQMPY